MDEPLRGRSIAKGVPDGNASGGGKGWNGDRRTAWNAGARQGTPRPASAVPLGQLGLVRVTEDQPCVSRALMIEFD